MEDVRVLDDFFRLQSKKCHTRLILACPKQNSDPKVYSAGEVEALVERAARILCTRVSALHSRENAPVVGITGPSNLEFMMTACGLSRLGYKVLVLSPRLSVAAYAALLQKTKCTTLFCPAANIDAVSEIASSLSISTLQLISEDQLFSSITELGSFELPVTTSEDLGRTAYIMHSSGSTGIPKPIYITHQRYLISAMNGYGLSVFLTLPFYHVFGLGMFYTAIFQGSMLILYDFSTPVTGKNVTKTIERFRPQQTCVVPYTLKLTGETEGGIAALKSCEIVTYHGSQCPDELGDHLSENGVHLVGYFGSTEAGVLATSQRPRGDKNWNYNRFLPSVIPHIWMKPIDTGLFELVCLESLKSRVLSNSQDPPNSLHTSDLWSPHPNIPDFWKFLGRIDDRITLLNGEKVLPLPIEGLIRDDPLVQEAVVFGIGRAIPGLFVFRSQLAANLSDDEFLEHLWPRIVQANERAEGFSQIVRELVLVFSPEVEFPKTDKGSLMRFIGYKKFEKEIDEVYHKFEDSSGLDGTLELGVLETECFLMNACRRDLGLDIALDADLFAAGMDSMKAIQLASLVRKGIKLREYCRELSTTDIYERGNLRRLARWLCADGKLEDEVSAIETMTALIEKYSYFEGRSANLSSHPFDGHTVVLTGATGSLGSHILLQLLSTPSVRKVICLIRHKPNSIPTQRLLDSLKSRKWEITPKQRQKILAIASILSLPSLGLEDSLLAELKKSVTVIIHAAWPVNFNISLQSFSPELASVQNLINLSLSVSSTQPAEFLFCSSISVAMRAPSGMEIPEEQIRDLSWASNSGYARSKLVGERIVGIAVEKGARGRILRIGQIVGDGRSFEWNEEEAIPLMVRSAFTLEKLPALREECSWLPVDHLATAILELSSVNHLNTLSPQKRSLVYNLVNAYRFHWTTNFLPKLKRCGIEFEIVTPEEWVAALRDSAFKFPVETNPTVKLLSFFEEKYGGIGGGGEEKSGAGRERTVVFSTEKAENGSAKLKERVDVIKDGYIEEFLKVWRGKWGL